VARRLGGNSGADALARIVAGTATILVVYTIVLFVLAAPELGALRRLGGGRVGGAASTS
jgi:hypothetical protein